MLQRVAGEEVFVLDLLQGRDPSWVRRPFFARLDPAAVWFDDLRPAFGEERFFFQEGDSVETLQGALDHSGRR